ncbi:MAG TPA: hypothetical protein VHE35_35600 [Kofleriaceae bacterium]|nr:hypothetical protein [Kofleriaceae bacterium]
MEQRARRLVLVGAWLTMMTGAARANMAAPPPPAEVGGLGAAGGPSPIEVVSDELVIDCSAGQPACRLEVTYTLRNAGSAAASGVPAFYALDTDDVTITVDGKPVARELSAADIAALDDSVRAASGGDVAALRADDPGLARHGFDLSLAPGATAQVVVAGTIHARERGRYYMSLPAAAARHRLYVRGGRTDRRIHLRYLVAPIRTWSGYPQAMTVTVKHPAGWRATLYGATVVDRRRTGGVVVDHGRLSTAEPELEIVLALGAAEPIHGGLLLGLGGQADDATGVRARVGVEAGRGGKLASLALEVERGDDETGLVAVPAVEVASPWVLVVPSIGLGVGVPVRLRPSLEVGVRFVADAHFGPVGFLTAVDWYPGMAADPRRFSVALLGQLSL